ncbi:Bestrophin-4 [Labeo rohita]|uniref:Bestrophin homolog n=1 Tax=Labeo rohita TaxID=84645 RepID=A0ABQ8MXL8_LABRO|nr:bestrophin-4 [Labeo rohita]XP_050990240.1 bestrophin-4 [Labeo rohita]KAI2667584.1 Bestrophin-4 [Labeo rohita]
MTVSYTLKVANAKFGGFSKLLFRWKGSIYKLLYREFLVFCLLYSFISILYRCVLTDQQQEVFERLARHCNKFAKLIPMSFVLGFYVTQAFQRWWGQYTSFPLPDNLMMVVSGNVHGTDERGRLLRRTLMRYANLSSVLILRSISTRVRKRFQTVEDIVEAGFMTTDELKKLNHLYSDFNKYWMPLAWFANLASQARKEGRVKDDIALRLLMDELNNYRSKCSMLFHYDWISIPLVYTQVVTVAVYSFFTFCLIGRQFVKPEKPDEDKIHLDLYVPIFTLLEFFFYAGWLKVGELIINPFGEDDDDFETNQLIDRNIQVSMLAVDDMHQNLPLLEKDKYWVDKGPSYPSATMKPVFMGSTHDMRILEDENEEPLPIPKTQMLAINVWPTTHKVRRQKNKSLQQLCLCSRSRCEDERSRLEQPSKAIIPLPPQQQNMTMQLVCHEKLLESPETAEQKNEEP